MVVNRCNMGYKMWPRQRGNQKIHSVQQIKKQLTEISYFGEAQFFPLIIYTDNNNFIVIL